MEKDYFLYDLDKKLEDLHDLVRECEKVQYKMERMIDLNSKPIVNEYMDLAKDLRVFYEKIKYKITDLRIDG